MKEKIAILKSEMVRDTKKLQTLFTKFEKSYHEFLSSSEYSRLIESAFYVNQVYSGFERIFKNVARTFENNIDDDYWHKSLLERMNLDLQDIRPALISEESFLCLDELRAFRHFFRHAYGVDINKEKFAIVAEKTLKIGQVFENEIKRFVTFLEGLIQG